MKRVIVIIFLLLVGAIVCGLLPRVKKGGNAPFDLPSIKEKGTLTAATLYSSTSYFQYKMQDMGYEYDLIKDFAESEGLRLEIKIAKNDTELIEMVEKGEADVIAYPIFVSNENKQKLRFCGHEQLTHQVIVQRANTGDTLLTDVTQLIGKQVVVLPQTKYAERLRNLNDELGGGIEILYSNKDSLSNEDLMAMVSKGEIAYTVSDDNVAKLNKTYYWNLDIRLQISFSQRSSWAVRQDTPLLAEAITAWANDKRHNPSFKSIHKRYFESSKASNNMTETTLQAGHISPFDELFQKQARRLGWDWRLLASIAYQESRFDTEAVSWAGAEGLMGIMPNTARQLGVMPHELKTPEGSIETAVSCLQRFRQGFSEVKDPTEKIRFTLAAYNAGIGHVYDAQRLASKYGKDPHVWEGNVAEFIRLKSDPAYYNDTICRHGYLRGTETVRYVADVMARFNDYRRKGK